MSIFVLLCQILLHATVWLPHSVKHNNKDSSEHPDTYHKFKLGRSQEVYSVRIAQKNRGGKHLTVEICQWWAWVNGEKNEILDVRCS